MRVTSGGVLRCQPRARIRPVPQTDPSRGPDALRCSGLETRLGPQLPDPCSLRLRAPAVVRCAIACCARGRRGETRACRGRLCRCCPASSPWLKVGHGGDRGSHGHGTMAGSHPAPPPGIALPWMAGAAAVLRETGASSGLEMNASCFPGITVALGTRDARHERDGAGGGTRGRWRCHAQKQAAADGSYTIA
jgi:hypothetical protein